MQFNLGCCHEPLRSPVITFSCHVHNACQSPCFEALVRRSACPSCAVAGPGVPNLLLSRLLWLRCQHASCLCAPVVNCSLCHRRLCLNHAAEEHRVAELRGHPFLLIFPEDREPPRLSAPTPEPKQIASVVHRVVALAAGSGPPPLSPTQVPADGIADAKQLLQASNSASPAALPSLPSCEPSDAPDSRAECNTITAGPGPEQTSQPMAREELLAYEEDGTAQAHAPGLSTASGPVAVTCPSSGSPCLRAAVSTACLPSVAVPAPRDANTPPSPILPREPSSCSPLASLPAVDVAPAGATGAAVVILPAPSAALAREPAQLRESSCGLPKGPPPSSNCLASPVQPVRPSSAALVAVEGTPCPGISLDMSVYVSGINAGEPSQSPPCVATAPAADAVAYEEDASCPSPIIINPSPAVVEPPLVYEEDTTQSTPSANPSSADPAQAHPSQLVYEEDASQPPPLTSHTPAVSIQARPAQPVPMAANSLIYEEELPHPPALAAVPVCVPDAAAHEGTQPPCASLPLAPNIATANPGTDARADALSRLPLVGVSAERTEAARPANAEGGADGDGGGSGGGLSYEEEDALPARERAPSLLEASAKPLPSPPSPPLPCPPPAGPPPSAQPLSHPALSQAATRAGASQPPAEVSPAPAEEDAALPPGPVEAAVLPADTAAVVPAHSPLAVGDAPPNAQAPVRTPVPLRAASSFSLVDASRTEHAAIGEAASAVAGQQPRCSPGTQGSCFVLCCLLVLACAPPVGRIALPIAVVSTVLLPIPSLPPGCPPSLRGTFLCQAVLGAQLAHALPFHTLLYSPPFSPPRTPAASRAMPHTDRRRLVAAAPVPPAASTPASVSTSPPPPPPHSAPARPPLPPPRASGANTGGRDWTAEFQAAIEMPAGRGVVRVR